MSKHGVCYGHDPKWTRVERMDVELDSRERRRRSATSVYALIARPGQGWLTRCLHAAAALVLAPASVSDHRRARRKLM